MHIYRYTIRVHSFKFLKTHRYDFANGFHDCTKDMVYIEYFGNITIPLGPSCREGVV
jgi:hypothetical protein